jgi:hypothetical protein
MLQYVDKIEHLRLDTKQNITPNLKATHEKF